LDSQLLMMLEHLTALTVVIKLYTALFLVQHFLLTMTAAAAAAGGGCHMQNTAAHMFTAAHMLTAVPWQCWWWCWWCWWWCGS
jgi:hypothetical protein